MSDPNKLLREVSSKYGAPMGRREIHLDPAAKVRIFRVRFVSGDYDVGGAYWGGGGTPLYAAIGDDFQSFIRAKNRKDAVVGLTKRFPDLKYYGKKA